MKLVGEIGLGSVKTGKDAAPMVRWAKKHGMTVTIHTGGPSIAGSNPISAEVVLEADPHVVGHINGGTTSMSEREIDSLVATSMALEIVHCGNGKTALHTLRPRHRRARAHRIIIGNDAPSGTGVVPLGILRVIAHLASLGGVAPEAAICMATGNTARVYGLPVGMIAAGPRGGLLHRGRADRARWAGPRSRRCGRATSSGSPWCSSTGRFGSGAAATRRRRPAPPRS